MARQPLPLPPARRGHPAARRAAMPLWIALSASLALAACHRGGGADQGPSGGGPGGRGGMQGPQAVTASVAKVQPMPVWVGAIGTVTPRALVNVMPRVSGLLQSVDYRQGQAVQAGQVLARIDPRPFEVAVQQAQAQVAQTQAQLAGAQRDLARYESLLKQDSIAEQQVADQRTTVAQLQATLKANQASLANAQLQLGWTRITAPVAGIVGLRPVDAGNLVNTSGAVGGGNGATSGTTTATPIAVIAQVQPVQVTFALPQQQASALIEQLQAGQAVTVQAWDAGNTRLLDTGRLLAADNQINTATGTLAFRAEFGNRDLALYPNAFVNVRVLVRTIPDALLVPTTAVAVGAPGTYVYVIGNAGKVALRKVATGGTLGDATRITSGLKAGEQVVTDGLDRLRDGAPVKVVQAQSGNGNGTGNGAAAPGHAPRRQGGAG